jgi:hypothetical protein
MLDVSTAIEVQDYVPWPHVILRDFREVVIPQGIENNLVRFLDSGPSAAKSQPVTIINRGAPSQLLGIRLVESFEASR